MTALSPLLLVEDNPLDLDLTLRAFKSRSLRNAIEIARDGEEAISWIARWSAGEVRPLVILLDLNLPRMNGLEVLRAYKADPVACTIPVVVLTTSAANDDVAAAYEAGANSYIIKPVDYDKFMEVALQIELYWTVTNHPPPQRVPR